MKTLRSLVVCTIAGILFSALSAKAAPYASSITNLGGGVIQYYLNTTPAAGAVTVTAYPSGGHPVLNPAAPLQGTNTFTIGTGTSLGSDTSYAISVAYAGPGAPVAETFAAANTPQTVWGGSPDPRGMDVNCYPSNGPTFGTVYMANGAAGTGHGLGLFPTHSDMSYAFGASSAGLDSASFTGGAGGSAPYKIGVSRVDGTVLVSAIDPTVGGVWAFDPYLDSSSATQLLAKGNGTCHGEIYGAPRSTGSLAQGNLVLYTYDYTLAPVTSNLDTFTGGAIGYGASYFVSYIEGQTAVNGGLGFDNVCRYTIGGPASLPVTTPPDLLYNYGLNYSGGGLPASIDIDAKGNIFSTSERSAVGSAPWCMVMSSNMETNLYLSATSATADALESTIAAVWDGGADVAGCLISISPDDQYVVLAGYYGYLAVFGMTNGVPNASALTLISPVPAGDDPPRGVAWDMADNVYVLNSDTGDLYVYDLGLTKTCTTSNDLTLTNGSFTLVGAPTVSVNATTPQAYQANNSFAQNGATPTPAVFTLSLSAAQGVPITAKFTLTGTGANTVNYTASSNGVVNYASAGTYSMVFPAGATSEQVIITPTATPVSGPSLSVILTVTTNGGYMPTPPTTATASIANSGPQELLISGTGAGTMYRSMPNDFVTFAVTRWGDTNCGLYTLPTSSLTITGTAVYNTDYTAGPQPVNYSAPATAGTGSIATTINPGDVSDFFEVGLPLSHGAYTGNLTIIAEALSGTSPEGTNYTGLTNTGTAMLLDNLNPPEAVIWSDPLTDPSDDVNWNVAFSQNTGLSPYIFFFPDYNGAPTQDYDANFGYSLATDFVPNSPSGASTGLRVTVNKLSSGAVGTGASRAAYLNMYPNNAPLFAGNFALRFSMNLVRGCADATATEAVLFGINHYGTNVNGWQGSAVQGTGAAAFSFTNADGIWFQVEGDAGQAGSVGGYPSDIMIMTGTNGDANSGGAKMFFPSSGYWPLSGLSYASYTNVFKNFGDTYDEAGVGTANGLYNALDDQLAADNDAGVPANVSGWDPDTYSTGTCEPPGETELVGPWTDVEVRQSNNVITMSMNKTVMFTYNNVTPFTNGTIMLGYMDPYDSLGNGGGAYFSDVRVLELSAAITNQPVGATIGSGTNYTFKVGAVGMGPFTNTWYYTNAGSTTQVQQDSVGTSATSSDSDSYGVTSPTPALTPGNAGKYYVVVQDASGVAITSSVVTLTVDLPAAITSGPTNYTNFVGGPASFSVVASGTTPAYQWSNNAVKLATNSPSVSGAVTNATLNLTNIQLSLNGDTYSVLVSNAYGNQSGSAVLTVLPPALTTISNMATNATSVSFKFSTDDPYDTTNSFKLLASTNLSAVPNAGFTNVTPLPAGTFAASGTNFTVTVPTNGLTGQEFFQIEHK